MAAVLTGSLALNVWLGIKVQAGPVVIRQAGFAVGETLPPLRGASPAGTPVVVAFDRPTLLYVFSPSCSWCDRDYENLLAMGRELSGQYQVVAVTRTSNKLSEYVGRKPHPGVVLAVDAASLPKEMALSLGLTPQTVVVDTGGLVQRVWAGALFDSRLREAELFFRLDLPGVTQAGLR